MTDTKKQQPLTIIQDAFPALSSTFILDQMTGLLDRGVSIRNWVVHLLNPEVMHQEVTRYRLLDLTNSVRVPERRGDMQISDWVRAFCITNPAIDLTRLGAFHVHYGSMFNTFGPVFAVLDNFVAVSFHGHDASREFTLSGERVYDFLFQRANLITTPSEYMKGELVHRGCPADKVVIHRYGVRLDRFVPRAAPEPRDRPIVLTVARLVEKKGIEYGLRAIAALRPRTECEYRIIGEGRLEASLKELVRELGLDGVVRFLGAQSKDRVLAEMRNADVFMLPSVTAQDGDKEGVPVALIEAHAVGLPVVSTQHSGIPELVQDGVTGFLAPERDWEQLAQHLRELLTSFDLRRKMGSAGRSRVEQEFDIHKLNDRLVSYFP
ncbi:MAG: glycosyltransferase [Bdellovibrionales bacterium]|nr:glycosyltransferase [Bdellovibrionales bacterium]